MIKERDVDNYLHKTAYISIIIDKEIWRERERERERERDGVREST